MDKKLSFLVLIFFLVLGTFATVLLQRDARQTRAANQTPDASLSFLIVSVKGGECTVNAIVRDSAQKGVPNKEVCVTSSVGTVNPPCAMTDESGIAEVKIISSAAGSGQVEANVTNYFKIPTQVSCQFNP